MWLSKIRRKVFRIYEFKQINNIYIWTAIRNKILAGFKIGIIWNLLYFSNLIVLKLSKKTIVLKLSDYNHYVFSNGLPCFIELIISQILEKSIFNFIFYCLFIIFMII